jgi:hypothetical protein
MVIDSFSHSLLMLIVSGTASLTPAAGSACAAPRGASGSGGVRKDDLGGSEGRSSGR